jgi:Dolichyl-phosphate-mannose-protein mannosyltransferase
MHRSGHDRGEGSDQNGAMQARRAAPTRVDVAVVLVVCALGTVVRVPGLTSRDLWFDDAWAALPAHVPLRDAVHMLVTTPLYTLALREWLLVGPSDTWWAQLPALVLGVAGIAAVYALVRAHGLPRLGAAAAAAVIAAGPVAITYSTRVKEYPADLVASCLVLWLAERWRRDPSARGLVALGAVGVGAIWTSASTAAVVGGAAALVVAVAWGAPRWRRPAAALVGALGLGAAVLWLVVLRHLPPTLRANWKVKGFLFAYRDAHHVAFAFEQTFAGLAHGLFGAPVAYTFDVYPLRAAVLALAAATAVVLAVLVAAPLVAVVRRRGRAVGPLVAAAAALALAVLGTLLELAPLGDGRTDEALYPPMLLLAVGGATWLARRPWARAASRTAGQVVVAVVVGVAAIAFGLSHRAAYPPTGLTTVMANLRPQLRPGDVVVLDGYESFTWADEHLGRWNVSFAQHAVPWPMGFHVASRSAHVVLSSNYLQPDLEIATLQRRAHRVWFVGPTVGGYSTTAPPDLWGLLLPTPTKLVFLGTPAHPSRWHAVRACCGDGTGAYAELFVWR